MKLFDGISRTDYQDLFRAIGLMLDQRNLRDIRIWEHADGLVIQGCPPGGATYQTVMLTDDDLNKILHSAYDRRKQVEG
ncbi:MAG TPA: hypothetical protein VEQ36_05020 [Thermomicrobiales bacterium]|nr:hypothetical protein [Thermomicrobiales bacterium]